MNHTLQAIEGYLANKADHGDTLAANLHQELVNTFGQKATLAIVLEGGLVQCIVSNFPEQFDCDVVVIDYDVEGADPGETTLVRQSDGSFEPACVHLETIQQATISLENLT